MNTGATPVTGTHDGHGYRVTYATEDDWPVTSVRVSLRRPLPGGIAIHPSGAAPWSSGRIGSRVVKTGDGEFDRLLAARADSEADLRMLGEADLRKVLTSAIGAHPGLWVGHDAVVVVERGHVRDEEAIEELVDEVATLATILETAAAATGRRERPGPSRRESRAPQERPAPQKTKPRMQAEARAQVHAAAVPGGAVAAEAAPAKPAAAPGSIEQFVRSCFDRSIASYEVNRRIAREWTGRTVHGTGAVVASLRLGGHDFDFGDLKGYKVEIRVSGPEAIAPVVRVQIQVDESNAPSVESLQPGEPTRFEGPLASANPLLHTVQIVSAKLGR